MERHKEQIRTNIDKKYQSTHTNKKCKQNQDKNFKRWNTKTKQKKIGETKNSKITQNHKRLSQLGCKRIEHVQKRIKSLFQPFFQALPFRAVT